MNGSVTMQPRVMGCLAERRRLGFGLESSGPVLMNFARHVDSHGYSGSLTVGIMADWARYGKKRQGKLAAWAGRLKLPRPFTRHLRQFEPLAEVPDWTVLGPIQERFTPHIYHEREIVGPLSAARGIGPKGGLRPATYEALFGLVASAGLRVSGAAHLPDTDVDLGQGMLAIRQAKSGKSRQLRNQYVQGAAGARFFVSAWEKPPEPKPGNGPSGAGLQQAARPTKVA